jgi:hypothetical protein
MADINPLLLNALRRVIFVFYLTVTIYRRTDKHKWLKKPWVPDARHSVLSSSAALNVPQPWQIAKSVVRDNAKQLKFRAEATGFED